MPSTLAVLDKLLAADRVAPEREFRQQTTADTRVVLFRCRRGLLRPEELNEAEIRFFAERDKVTPEEVRRWHASLSGRRLRRGMSRAALKVDGGR